LGTIWLTTLLAGAGLGVGFGMLRELLDRGFRTKEQVQSALSLQCLSLVPMLTDRAMLGILNDPRSIAMQARTAPMVAATIGNTVIKRVHKTSRLMRTILHAPGSVIADAVRMIKLNVELEGGSKPMRVLGLTSAFPGEGKSSLAAALATVIAQGGQRVILVDCDLRNPSLSRALSPDAKSGLVDAMKGRAKIQELIWTDPASGLSFLPAVANSKASSSEFLASPEALTLFTALRKFFDYVIVDLPPLVAATDVRASSQLLDSYIMVVEWGRTKVDAVQYAMRHAPGVYERTAGIVLNKVDVEIMSRYDTYGGMYYGYAYGEEPPVKLKANS
jgi:capsular exopolysaccharide synthesis family protein